MTPRERYIATLTFNSPDRIPLDPGRGRRSTRERWHREGLPRDVDIYDYLADLLEIPREAMFRHYHVGHGVVTTMMPEFEEKVIEQRPESRIVQDWKGNVCEIGNEYMPSDLRGAPDFCTRSWLKCPVESRADWPDMARRYDINQAGRFPADFAQRCAQMRDRDLPVTWGINGPFWQLREWCGFEGLCMLILDDPDFVKEMIALWQRFIAAILEKALAQFTPDLICVSEDMAYKEKPMIGPEQCRQFLVPCWTQWGQIMKSHGVPIYDIDSDGHVGLLIEPWLEAGVMSNSPQEVAAGNDLPAYRRRYGTRMAYRGGVDKRAMAAGGAVLRREIERLRPAVEAGGYLPSCDHGVPSDVSWPNFVEYTRLLAQVTGWLPKEAHAAV
jgi:uroporphyrinogen decarboxylase